ncbi:unnamed protein product, partial [Fusarium langsethiae]
MKPSTPLEAARSKSTTPEIIRRFYEILAATARKLKVSRDRMHNMDEHGMEEGHTKSGRVLGSSLSRRAIVTASDNRNWSSVIESGNAEGRILTPTMIFQGKSLQKQWFPEDIPNWGFDCSESGWANARICLKWLREIFLPETRPKDITNWRILLVDGFSGHISPQFRFLALQNRVQVIYLPPHSSHITQPFDVAVFGPVKAAFRRHAKRFASFA